MKFRKSKYEGVWFLWPAVIYYPELGLEIRWLKWYAAFDWDKK